MIDWIPTLTQNGKPRYLAIAEAIAVDIRTGTLSPGDRLPPQRRLAALKARRDRLDKLPEAAEGADGVTDVAATAMGRPTLTPRCEAWAR